MVDPPALPASPQEGQDIETSLREPNPKVRQLLPKLSNKKFTKLIFFKENSRFCPPAYRGSSRWQKWPLDGATDFLSKV